MLRAAFFNGLLVDNAPLVVFRVLFGALMVAESFGAIATGWVREVFVEPPHTFPLMGFESLRVLHGPWMYGYFAVMGGLAAGVMLGLRYRASATGLALLWSCAYLAQKSHYNNHYYLAAVVSWGMVLAPAHLRASLDERRGRVQRVEVMPALVRQSFQLLLGVVFTYAAIAKLYPGWLEGDYLRVNLGSKGDRWPLGALVVQPWFQTFTIYSAILFDALVVPGLVWRRTRLLAFLGLVGFNLFNSVVFRIGIFPYMVLAWTVFFFDAATVLKCFRWLPRLASTGQHAAREVGNVAWPVRAGLFVFFAVQVLLPLRHFLIPGDVLWTDEGHRMSWRMMLRTRWGDFALTALDRDTGEAWPIELDRYLSPTQLRRAAVSPEYILQLARLIERDHVAEGRTNVALYCRWSRVSVNGGEPGPLIDPSVDLTRARWSPFGHDDWVLDPPAGQ